MCSWTTSAHRPAQRPALLINRPPVPRHDQTTSRPPHFRIPSLSSPLGMCPLRVYFLHFLRVPTSSRSACAGCLPLLPQPSGAHRLPPWRASIMPLFFVRGRRPCLFVVFTASKPGAHESWRCRALRTIVCGPAVRHALPHSLSFLPHSSTSANVAVYVYALLTALLKPSPPRSRPPQLWRRAGSKRPATRSAPAQARAPAALARAYSTPTCHIDIEASGSCTTKHRRPDALVKVRVCVV